ncbi:putative DNA binding domain-containing protein [Bifidobacterium breve]|uniref:RNA-binding domain-containing protein n=1 Tax=Bifidobacterium breve TaxID=1685 RepID=UPI00232D8BB6|nr:RNA-binding domain-containing protein [Bifidobacterium breve]MDB1166018.1 putative DNA binding domain-containing protein [Bifidobacterium breve]MDB1168948.1 putative DNA binding domain-containing protein [Bifidobacterium breve]MDB1174391.1 putative DNA binding domain-containing protein [Bifidobacterium breve]MDB1178546.1 putative DNA binding domain-containing protein [Bifidobacterium breve]
MAHEYGKETLSLEFKSDLKRLPDDDLLDAVVALANSDGGTVYLGVEDDGTPTGIDKVHQDAVGLSAMIANRTVPPVSARAQIVGTEKTPVMQIDVPKSRSVVSTKSGKVLRRRMKVDGTPESVPMYPYEIATRLSDLGRLDFSAQPVPDATRDDFDPLERDRLRRIIGTYQSSDRNLLELTDEELEKSLQLTVTVDGETMPTLTGLLLLGKGESLKRFVPTHRASFQVMSGTDIKVNQDYAGPLLKTIEQINDMFSPWNPSAELSVGLFSMMVPEFDHRAFREALVNAFGHRDYTLLGRVRVQLDDAGLTIANPGGFVEGINIHNLLTAEPYGRNPCLMDALKRTGLAERTGRGIDRIFEGALNYGRPLPDYSRSNRRGVSVLLPRSVPDKAFVELLAEERERSGKSMSLDGLLILDKLKSERRCGFDVLSGSLDMSDQRLRTVLGQLTEAGLVESAGVGARRTYMLGAKVYRRSGRAMDYVRQSDIDRVRYPELIIKLMHEQKSVSKNDVMELLHLEGNQAYYQLRKLVLEGRAKKVGSGRNVRYAAVR